MEFKIDEASPYEELLNYFASFLQDILSIAKNMKTNVYSLIGIDPPNFKEIKVFNNIYSIMEGCNKSFDNLRRAETLLRGHLKGKQSSSRGRDSGKQSRLSAMNFSENPRKVYQLNQIYPYKTFQQPSEHKQLMQEFSKNATSRLQPYEQKNKCSDRSEREEIYSKKKLNQSKSVGQLVSKSPQSLPLSEANSYQLKIGSQNPVDLIKKIRVQLGLNDQQ